MIAAAEAVVVDLLNATYPRAAHDAKDGTSGDTADNAAVARGRAVPFPTRLRVNGPPRGRGPGRRRSLVYYTAGDPVVISDMVDVPCNLPGANCIRVESVVYLQLEEGDDAADIRRVVEDGLQESIDTGSFFNVSAAVRAASLLGAATSPPTHEMFVDSAREQGMPADTVFCPRPSTPPPTVAAASPTPLPTATAPLATPAPTTGPRTPAPQGGATASPTYGGTPFVPETLQISLQYSLQNSCPEFTAGNIMNEVDNTLKQGLIGATASVTIRILNETFPRADTDARRQRRGLAHIRAAGAPTSARDDGGRRHLVYYTPDYPVDIVNVLDIDPGSVLIITTIPVVLEPGDDPAVVNEVVVRGLQESVEDGSFFGAIPPDTVYICS